MWLVEVAVIGADETKFRQKEARPYHIDYCFIPKSWAPLKRHVEVGAYGEWAKFSDHRPLVVDLDLPE